ncbi:MAG TPA: flagellar basal body P-ring formation chaperone FlgA [Pseudidiomarina sp.]|nr:flagellar basal body P-ring formation chaperone FlgA [Pseudidiomarina sp.]
MPAVSSMPQWERQLRAELAMPLQTLADDYDLVLSWSATRKEQLKGCQVESITIPEPAQLRRGRALVPVICKDSPRPHYVPITISLLGTYYVLADSLSAGTLITAAHLRAEQGDLTRLPYQALRDPADIIGQQTRRSLVADTVIQQSFLQAPIVIERGQTVTVTVSGAGFVLRQVGTALDAGGVNEIIRVRLENKNLLSVKVTGPGQAEPAS